jgi:hypothetical protein
MLNFTNRANSQHEILCILSYTKRQNLIYYIVNSKHFNTIQFCQILSFSCSLVYKVSHLITLHGLYIQHWLPLEFCFRIF